MHISLKHIIVLNDTAIYCEQVLTSSQLVLATDTQSYALRLICDIHTCLQANLWLTRWVGLTNYKDSYPIITIGFLICTKLQNKVQLPG